MTYTWVVVADSTRARIFDAESSSAGNTWTEKLPVQDRTGVPATYWPHPEWSETNNSL